MLMEKKGYLDFHTHILPGTDDGAKDMEVTKRMLQLAHQQGVRTMLATPHSYPGRTPQDNERVRALCEKVNQEAQKIDSEFHVFTGNEILYRESILSELEDGHILTLADSRYLLIEFLPGEHIRRINEGIRQLIHEEYYPVIAHVEKVGCLMENPDYIKELVDMGCYMQANCEDFLGGIFNRQSKNLRGLMEQGLIHFLGSDCHDESVRPPLMEDCIRQLEKKITKQKLYKVIYENPNKFLQKQYL